MDVQELIENFSFIDDWEERYRYLIEIGEGLPEMDVAARIDDNKVEGCTSQVWIDFDDSQENVIQFTADSDAMIVKGLIGILSITFNGKTYAEVQKIDIQEIFAELGLDQHLSPNRRNGFFSMVERIGDKAAGRI